MNPTIPKQINPFALACLEALQKSGLGNHVSLGGALGLTLYHEFRSTKDVDAWWTSEATAKEQKEVIEVLRKTLEKFGEVKLRRFGDVVSLDLYEKEQVCFNFQIANRSVQLRPPLLSPWAPVKLDTFEDLVASKMAALIERGIPRDFLDIYEICNQKLCTTWQCWRLWLDREAKRGVQHADLMPAAAAVLMHLNRIEKTRPLNLIKDQEAREKATELREWFKNVFTKEIQKLD
ncbi:MAG TPA: nucleotidyl transferase AbiEii/AbiGii toxin family protein [bacterium]